MMRSESDITASIRAALDRHGIWAWKHHSGGYFGIKGVPDLIGSLPGTGRAFYIEVKKEGWTPPKATNAKAYEHYQDQLKFIVRAKVRGYALAGFATSVEEALEIIGIKEVI